MLLKRWEDLPGQMRNDAVKPYYKYLEKRKGSLIIKRIFDVGMSCVLLIVLSPILGLVAILIKRDSKGNVFFKQKRITQYGRPFMIFKFRTMVENAEALGSQVTIQNDSRVTKVGQVLRKYRLDELPQLINILKGEMSFVGTRPEVEKYVNAYTDEMMATLLLPAGVTSEASINFKDEDQLLSDSANIDTDYISEILPIKMTYNLANIKDYSLFKDMVVMVKTGFKVLR
ncbi:Sugar transferase involved in LPS biosynthesis (colanic, teichoic acid) [Eubacterium aggregans]|uniref:Sugar transferase involved in LPS biosynthesis (Colanic, teichoic acid) n=2 Tax=Eubacterium aggregans TaxID=81409 RepID=A0A1H3YAG4_9FIRM|nr:Sugar transferase involved in LPS biosynthesis (colanic, teichoic acid) [Eubacterium aggregans]